MLARLFRALSSDSKIKLGSLVAPLGRRTHSKKETILLATHFPKSVVTEEMATPAAACRTSVVVGG